MTRFTFDPTALHNLLFKAASDREILHFAGADRTINSSVLLCEGISFALWRLTQLVVVIFGSFGTCRLKILIVSSVAAGKEAFGSMNVHTPEKSPIALDL